jgi:RND family efflux transporter MFP subunit
LSRCGWWGGAALLAVLLTGCGPKAQPKAAKMVEVTVTTPITDEVLDSQDFTGRLDAFRTVDIRARVQGYVDKAPFKEGDLVRKGDVLFEIDPRPYQTDLAQAEANLKLAKADRRLQDLNAGRARTMIRARSIGREEYDQILATRDKSIESVRSMTATRDRAALYLSFTKVIAPVSGRISRRNVDPGNLIKADDTLLTTIVADDRVYAYFDVDERTYLDLVGEKPSASSSDQIKDLKLPVRIRLANAGGDPAVGNKAGQQGVVILDEEFTHTGHVDFVDNRLNGNTGTIRMRAVIENPRHTLKSGLFVRVRLPIGKPYRALLVNDEALLSDQARKYVYVVKTVTEEKDGSKEKKDVVEYRFVKLGQAIGNKPVLRVIKAAKRKDGKIVEGLEPGERVVITNQQRVRRGLAVRVKMKAPPVPPRSPWRKLLGLRGPGSGDKVTR